MAASENSAVVQPTENSTGNEPREETQANKDSNTPRGTPTPDHHTPMAPTSPTYPPYGVYVDPAHLAANGFDISDPSQFATYIYPVSPQFSVQYYPDYGNGYQSYPGSPALHPQSPPMNPTSPPFSPTFQYQQGVALSPPTHAYILPHPAQSFPPLHISSPVLTANNSMPGSPPHQYLPGPYVIQTDSRQNKRHNQQHYSQKQHYNQQHTSNQHYNQQQQYIQHNQLQQELEAEENSYHTHNIYVRGLSSSTTDESFLEMCEKYGTISSSKAILDQKTGECKGFGFAMFINKEECDNAIEGLNQAGFQASYAKVGQESFSSRLKHLQDETSTNIYISNLPLDTTEQSLEELFQPYQTVSNRILRDPQTGMSRGVGFARLTDREAAAAIIDKFNGFSIEGCSAPLQVRFADSPAQKRLKNQTARKKVVRPREFQPVATFAVRPMMSITPETMLGLAPSTSASIAPGIHMDPYLYQPQPAPHYAPKPGSNKQEQNHQDDSLANELNRKMKISDTA